MKVESNLNPSSNSTHPGGENKDLTPQLEGDRHLRAALRYRSMGYSVIPVKPRTKEAMIPWGEYQKRIPSEEEIQEWWRKNPEANVAIVLGKVSDLMTLEVDDMAAIKGKHIPVTPQAISGGRGLPHIYFKYTAGAKNHKEHENGRELFSIRCNGQYVLVPP